MDKIHFEVYIRASSAVIFASQLRKSHITVVRCDLEDRQGWRGTIWHHHGDWTWQPSGTLTSLNHQVGLNRRSLLLHLYAVVSEAPNMPRRNEWQRTKCQQILQLHITAAYSSDRPDTDGSVRQLRLQGIVFFTVRGVMPSCTDWLDWCLAEALGVCGQEKAAVWHKQPANISDKIWKIIMEQTEHNRLWAQRDVPGYP